MNSTALHCTSIKYTTVHCTVLHCTYVHFTALHCTWVHCTALHCTWVHCTALYCPALHCSALCVAPAGSQSVVTASLPPSCGERRLERGILQHCKTFTTSIDHRANRQCNAMQWKYPDIFCLACNDESKEETGSHILEYKTIINSKDLLYKLYRISDDLLISEQ